MTSYVLAPILTIILLIGIAIAGAISFVVDRMTSWTYDQRLGFAILFSLMLGVFTSILMLAALAIPPTFILNPIIGPAFLICIILLDLQLVKKDQ